MSKVKIENRRGSQFLEFVIIMPVCLVVLMALFYLNSRLEEKQYLQISARNSASKHLVGSSINQDYSMSKELKKLKLFASKEVEDDDMTVAVRNNSDHNNVMKRIKYQSEDEDSSGSESSALEVLGGITNAVDTVAKYSGVVVHQYYQTLQNNLGMNLGDSDYHLLPKANYNYLKIAFKRKNKLSLFAKTNGKYLGLGGSEFSYLNALQYTRKSSGYHPDEYKLPAIAGYGIGLAINSFSDNEDNGWGSYEKQDEYRMTLSDDRNSFSRDCLMLFGAKDDCSNANGNQISTVIQSIGSMISITKLIGKIFSGGSSEVLDQALMGSFKMMNDQIQDRAADAMQDYIKRETKKIGTESVLNKFEEAIQKVKR